MTDSASLAALAEALGPRATRDATLARYSGVGIGGPADVLAIAHGSNELAEIVRLGQEANVRWRIFGGLTNVLLPDSGLRGLVILNHARHIHYDETQQQLTAESGAIAVKVAKETVAKGWGGLTWAVGLPGTIGGAVVNNAGAFGGEISSILISADVLGPDGRIHSVEPEWFAFQYRYSRLKGTGEPWVVLSATFQMALRDRARLAEKADEYTARRQRTQPPGRTLGSTFKNPPEDYAGRLIEAAGLKGTHRGRCSISEKHANFFMNDGNGTAADFKALIEVAQIEVERQFSVRLEPEIEII